MSQAPISDPQSPGADAKVVDTPHVERLRDYAAGSYSGHGLMTEAADRIERLEQELAEAKASAIYEKDQKNEAEAEAVAQRTRAERAEAACADAERRALERAAKVCEGLFDEFHWNPYYRAGAVKAAEAIRALPTPPQENKT